MGEVENSPIDLPQYPPTPRTHNFSAVLEFKFDGCDEVLDPCSPSFGPFAPLDLDVLCSPVLNFSCDVHEDQVMDGVGVKQPNCDIILMSVCGNLNKNMC